MYWFYLLIAGLFEIGWAIGLKMSDGFSKPLVSGLTLVGMVLSYYFLALALKILLDVNRFFHLTQCLFRY